MSYRNGFLLAALALVTLLGALPLASRAQCGEAAGYSYRARYTATANACGGAEYAVTERVRFHRHLFGGLFRRHHRAAAGVTQLTVGACGATVTYAAPTPQAAPTFPAPTPQAPSKVLPVPTAPPKVAPAPAPQVVIPAPQAAARPVPTYDPLAPFNAIRARLGIPLLRWDAGLAIVAAQNNALCQRRGLGHWHLGGAAQVTAGTANPQYAAQIWEASPSHRVLMLDPHVRLAGFNASGGYSTLSLRR